MITKTIRASFKVEEIMDKEQLEKLQALKKNITGKEETAEKEEKETVKTA